jgi:chaperone required for assembly of F1-ATPase
MEICLLIDRFCLLIFASAPYFFHVALEWDAQTNVKTGIVPASMPLMILASTAIDHVLIDPSDARKTCLSFLPTDTALFQTTSGDRILLEKQRQSHEPILQWLHDTLGIKLDTTDAMVFRIQHSEDTIQRMKTIVENMVRAPFSTVADVYMIDTY